MTDQELLSWDNLAVLFARFGGCNEDVLDYLRAHCSDTPNTDIQGIVGGYADTHAIANFRLQSDEEAEAEKAFYEAVRAPLKEAEAFVEANKGKRLGRVERMRMGGYAERIKYGKH